jgi:HD-GYP domain-containing protein (c-di-GMP phosphodiesterase class II)
MLQEVIVKESFVDDPSVNDPQLDVPLYNSRILYSYLMLIKSQYSYLSVDELLKYAGIENYQVEDEGHWFTQNQINLFQQLLREKTGNRNIAREAGKFASSPGALGMMRRYVLGLIGPENAYELIGKYASKLTRSSKYSVNTIGSNKVEIQVTPNHGIKEEPYQCENRQGFWEGISVLFNYKLPQIEHPECIFKGGKSCRYIVSWQESRSELWRKRRDVAGLSFLFASPLIPFAFSLNISAVLFSLFLSIVLLLTVKSKTLEVAELKNAVENLSWSSDKLIEQVNVIYENSLLINEIGQALSRENDLSGILSQVVDVLEKRLDYDRGLILLANSDNSRLISRAGYGYELDELSKFMMSSGFHLDRKESKGVFVNCYRLQKPFLVNNLDEIRDDLSFRSLEFAKKMGVKSFICCPIVYEGESQGVLAVDNLKTKRPLVQSDINILMGIAPQIAVGIHNIRLVDARLKQFQSILQALVASTEARDPITAGHSEKVTEYAVGMCQQMGLPNEYTDMIRVAASLHDYGKIGVDDVILKKPDRLTEEEYQQIKTHVDKTKNILTQVNFEGVYKEVPEIAASHHEKVDGTGYPRGLTGDEIPFGGKVIAVADVFEALTSRRHYRDPMPVNEALDYLVKKVGTQFDKRCVEAFIEYFNSQEMNIPYIPKGQFNTLPNGFTN